MSQLQIIVLAAALLVLFKVFVELMKE